MSRSPAVLTASDDHRAGPVPQRCRGCGARGVHVFFTLDAIPVHSSLLLRSVDAARAIPRGDLRLARCDHCGYVQNLAFDETLLGYTADYEDSQAFSGRFVAFAEELSGHLTERYGLRGGHVLEIGCGKGDFLSVLCETAGARGTGYDPAIGPGALPSDPERIRLHAERFTSTTALPDDVDLLVCRHTLEHLPRPASFLAEVRRALDGVGGVPVFFEVPDLDRILAGDAFWDVYYEHCGYFNAASLAAVFGGAGFEVVDLRRGYDDQYLLLEASPGSVRPARLDAERIDRLAAATDGFARRVEDRLADLQEELRTTYERGERLVLWGAGSKPVGLLAGLGDSFGIEHVVDVNPHKHGTYLPGTGQEIVAPERLRQLRPDHVLLMNATYRAEVGQMLDDLGVPARLTAL